MWTTVGRKNSTADENRGSQCVPMHLKLLAVVGSGLDVGHDENRYENGHRLVPAVGRIFEHPHGEGHHHRAEQNEEHRVLTSSASGTGPIRGRSTSRCVAGYEQAATSKVAIKSSQYVARGGVANLFSPNSFFRSSAVLISAIPLEQSLPSAAARPSMPARRKRLKVAKTVPRRTQDFLTHKHG